jgi:hypothetical protein
MLLAVLAGGTVSSQPSDRSNAAPASSAAPSSQGMFAGVTVRAPDAFYDPPANVPNGTGALLRSEPLKDVTLFSPAELKGDPHYSGFIRVVGGEATVRKHLEHLVVARENIRAEFANSLPLRDPRQMLQE